LEDKKESLRQAGAQKIETEKASLLDRLKAIKAEVKSKEQQDLKTEELKLKSKQRIQHLKEQLDNELANAENVFKTVKDMVKRLDVKAIVSEDEYLKLMDYEATDHLKVGMGAEAMLELVKHINLETLANELRQDIKNFVGAKRVKATKRLRVVEGMKNAQINPEWMILKVLPVIPPDLRPMVQLSGGRFASSDLNDLYRRVINRNNRLKHLIDLGARKSF
jgi:DNA-directed RNA polymerase subunit beta'